MSEYKNQKMNRLINDNNTFRKTKSFMSLESSFIDPSPTSDVRQTVSSLQSMREDMYANQTLKSPSQLKFDAWVKEEQVDMKLQEESASIKDTQYSFRYIY
jgi:hypothetical protein